MKNYSISFKPAWWLDNGHLQTIFPTLCRPSPHLLTERKRLQTPDRDFIDIDYYGDSQWPLVIILHGLTGSSDSIYVKSLQRALFEKGLRSVALNFRGCSGKPNNTSRWYHSGETSDLNYLYQMLRNRQPQMPMAAVGFSLGGNVLLKWLGENGEQLKLFAAVSVSAPLKLDLCATRLDCGFSKFYRNRLIHELKTGLHEKHQHLLQLNLTEEAKKISALGDISQIKSFWQYDEQVIARLYDFRSAMDYYQRNSARPFLKNIYSPTLLIQANDDPFLTPEVIPQQHELSKSVDLEITKGGGHVGFIYGHQPFKPLYWLDKRIPDFLSEQLAISLTK